MVEEERLNVCIAEFDNKKKRVYQIFHSFSKIPNLNYAWYAKNNINIFFSPFFLLAWLATWQPCISLQLFFIFH